MNDARLKQASEWLLRLNAPEVDEHVAARWLEWCQSDPENLAAFERMRALWHTFDDKRLSGPLALETVSSRHRRFSRAAIAATVLLAVGIPTWFVFEAQRGEPYTQLLRTGVASLRSQVLPDGSRVELGARSIAHVRFANDRRTVLIEDGEAFFNVVKDPDRPFIVQAGALQVVAVGTAFNVRKTGARVVVSVEEGVVNVASTEPVANTGGVSASIHLPADSADGQVRAGAGLQVTYSADERTLTMAKVRPASASAWRAGRLEFVNEPLGAVIADLNRYSQRRISLDGERLATLVYTGTVRSDAIDDWLTAVEEVFPVTVVDHGAAGIALVERTRVPENP